MINLKLLADFTLNLFCRLLTKMEKSLEEKLNQEKAKEPKEPKINDSVVLVKKKGHKTDITTLANFKESLSSDVSDRFFFTGSEDGQIRLWDLRIGGAARLFSSPETQSCIFS